MLDIFKLFKDAIDNDFFIKIENRGNSIKDKTEALEDFFYENEFLISGISYTKSDVENYKRKKAITETNRLISHIDESFYYISIYELFYITKENRNKEALNSLQTFFLLLKKAHLSNFNTYIDLELTRKPLRLFAIIKDKNKNPMITELKDIENEVNNLLINDAHIKNWSSETAKRIKIVSSYIGIEISKSTVLDVFEEMNKMKFIISLKSDDKASVINVNNRVTLDL